MQIANFCYQSGCTLLALKTLEDGGDFPQSDPNVQLWRLEAGHVEEVYEAMLYLEQQLEAELENAEVKQFGLSPSSSIRSAIATAALAVGDYERAIKHWTRQAEETEQQAMLSLLGTLPMVNRPAESSMFLKIRDDWATYNWGTAVGAAYEMPGKASPPLLNAGFCYLEIGQPRQAAEVFERLLEIHPESPYRQLLGFYILLAKNKAIDPMPPSQYVPVWDGMFAPDPAPAVAEKPEK
jgi:tetratricopeptide (TPR) repeat protein